MKFADNGKLREVVEIEFGAGTSFTYEVGGPTFYNDYHKIYYFNDEAEEVRGFIFYGWNERVEYIEYKAP